MLDITIVAIRLAIFSAFVALAIEDIRTRTCPRWVWYPIVGLGLLALTLEAITTPSRTLLGIRTLLGLALLGSIAAILWLSPAGNADAKAFLAIAIAFPTALGGPLATWGPAIPFGLTIFLNTVLLAILGTLLLGLLGRLERGVPFLAYIALGILTAITIGDPVVLALAR